MEFHNKVAIITGGSSGIGKEIMLKFLEKNIKNVTILDIDEEKSKECILEITKIYGRGKAIFIKTDVGNEKQMKDAFEKTFNTFKRIDIVINNAGTGDNTEYVSTINTNLVGSTHGTYLGLKYMSKENGGNGGIVINVASTAALTSFPISPTYCSTKHGLIGLTISAGHPLMFNNTGVKVFAICPGPTDTMMLKQSSEKYGNDNELWNQATGENSGRTIQKPISVARSAIYVMEKGETGSVWHIISGNLYKVNLPKPDDISELVIKDI